MVGNTGRHTHAQTDTTYNCACLLCVCVDFFPCVVTLTTRRMRNVWQIQCEPLLLPHTLHSYHLCTNVANSAYKCNKVAGLPFYLSAPRSFSLVLFGEGDGGKGRGHKALPVSELSLTAHSGMHTHTHTQARMHAHVASAMG